MNVGFYSFYNFYNNNRMFSDLPSPIGEDLTYPFVHLQKYFTSRGHKVATIDTDRLENFDRICFLDYPTKFNSFFRKLLKSNFANLYLVPLESKIIRPDNWDVRNHQYFKKVFTWDTTLVDSKKYVHLALANKIKIIPQSFDIARKNLFCVNISGNKYNSNPLELYSERIAAIKWFELNQPDKFDLYGVGWDRWFFSRNDLKINNILWLLYKKFPFLPKYHGYSSYRGRLKTKIDVLQNYKFAICYENARLPGYITEKIFDCYFAGVIPIYIGAPDILKFIPGNTFINRDDFSSYDELYKYLNGMTKSEHQNYLNNIYSFLNSRQVYPFSAECFAETLYRELMS
jgi:alpha(1,3/1,4) fucosyltransferase